VEQQETNTNNGADLEAFERSLSGFDDDVVEPTSGDPDASGSSTDAQDERQVSADAGADGGGATAPGQQEFEWKGKKYTIDQLVNDGILGKVFTSAEQLPSLQKKHEEALGALRELQSQQQQQQNQQSQQQQAAPGVGEWRDAASNIVKLIASGAPLTGTAFETFGHEEWRELAAASPTVVADLVTFFARTEGFMREAMQDRAKLNQMLEFRAGLEREATNYQTDSTLRQFAGQLDGWLDAAAKDDDYQALRDGETREKFWQWLGQVFAATPIDRITEEQVRRQYWAFLEEVAPDWRAKLRAIASSATAGRPGRAFAAGDSVGRGSSGGPLTDFERLDKELESAGR